MKERQKSAIKLKNLKAYLFNFFFLDFSFNSGITSGYKSEQKEYNVNIEKTINSYFLITVENEFNFHRVLSGLNFYGYILEPYKEHPTKVMRLNTEIIYNDKLKYIEGIYLEEIIGDSNKGYGSKVMKSFLEYIRPLHVKYVTGTLSMVDEIHLENKSRRDHFYKKFGFEIKGNHIYLELNK